MFEPLRDPEFFFQVKVDDFGAVCWPNGADLAPDALYQKLLITFWCSSSILKSMVSRGQGFEA